MHRVLIIDNDQEDSAFMEELIASHPDLDRVATASTCVEALDLLDGRNIDIILVDVFMPDDPGVTVLTRACELGIPTLVITMTSDEQSAMSIMGSGVSGYLLKDSDAHLITDSIIRILGGEAPLNPLVARYLLNTIPPSTDMRQESSNLTASELTVLELIAVGHSDKQCAATLGRSVNTISTHIKHIYAKLQVNSRAQAISRAIACGLVEPGDLTRRMNNLTDD